MSQRSGESDFFADECEQKPFPGILYSVGEKVGLQNLLTQEQLHRVQCPYCERRFTYYHYLRQAFALLKRKVFEGSNVWIDGFGTFRISRRKARAGWGENARPATYDTLKFKASRGTSRMISPEQLREGLNTEDQHTEERTKE